MTLEKASGSSITDHPKLIISLEAKRSLLIGFCRSGKGLQKGLHVGAEVTPGIWGWMAPYQGPSSYPYIFFYH